MWTCPKYERIFKTTNQTHSLIVKPMSKELDLKFYQSDSIQSLYIKRSSFWGKKWAHQIRIKDAVQIDEELLRLLKMGFDFCYGD